MCKNKKYIKIEKISNSKINLLYSAFPSCKNCKNGCIGEYKGICKNKEIEYTLNDIIDMINDNYLNLREVCKRKNLDYDIMKDYLKGIAPMKFSYYSAILEALGHPDYNMLEKEFMNSRLVKEEGLIYG